jgi:hypothetical protein
VEAIKPGSIKKLNASKMRFKMMENVEAFVKACKQLGVRDQILFDAPDLCDRRNLMKVVTCIHTLADIASDLGFEPKMVRLVPKEYEFGKVESPKKKVLFYK